MGGFKTAMGALLVARGPDFDTLIFSVKGTNCAFCVGFFTLLSITL
jgi:hypothetical protein